MTCQCGANDRDAEAKVYDLLATAGLRGIAEQTLGANRVMAESIRHLQKADRAAVLGYGQEVVTLHRSAGERANRMWRRQYNAVIQAIDERISKDDWPELVANARREYDVHDGPQLEDSRADFKARLLDLDTFSSTLTSRTAALMDEASDRIVANGLNGGMQLLREHLDRALSDLAAPEMGRQPASPDTTAVLICVAATLAIMVIALLICASAPFCWCCLAPFIIIACFINIGACAVLENV